MNNATHLRLPRCRLVLRLLLQLPSLLPRSIPALDRCACPRWWCRLWGNSGACSEGRGGAGPRTALCAASVVPTRPGYLRSSTMVDSHSLSLVLRMCKCCQLSSMRKSTCSSLLDFGHVHIRGVAIGLLYVPKIICCTLGIIKLSAPTTPSAETAGYATIIAWQTTDKVPPCDAELCSRC